ncbi:hypothetical protein VT84_33130 [Gemmata sp. SH-PL17]|uniref:hypothetical protein n=1 Tax=Gemmata sp. SH-PL17 TaxID=1630693 RepID=UPI00078BFC3B|nr:hypothetical protein [Gemmata sp. SH-PL17]AMV29286.1 hypothetical protein VT84_33130 [Gemmata sp. SH-PL17]
MAGTANDVRAGGAWYELWGKDKLTPVLERAKKGAESLTGALKSAGKKAGGGLDMVLGGIKGKAVELAVQLATGVGRAVVELVANVEELRKEYERTSRAIAQADQLGAMNMKRRTELIESEIDPKKKVLAIDKEIARLEQDRAVQQGLKEYHQDKKDRLATFRRKGTLGERVQAGLLQTGGAIGLPGLEEATADLQAHIDAANAARDKAFERLQELSDQRAKLLNPGRDPERIKEIAELTRELKKQGDTFGQTAEQIQIYEQMLKGATFWQIAFIAAAQGKKKRDEAVGGAIAAIAGGVEGMGEELKKEIEEVTKALKEQADTWNMTAEQAALFKLKAKGANDGALDKVKGEVGRLNMLNVLGGAAEAIAGGVAAVEKMTLASPGSFSAGNAAQRFGADTIPAKQLKAAEETAKNTGNIVKAISDLGRGLTFK